MSYKVAENMGWQKVLNVAEMLNNGARVEDIARYLGCSKGRASRKINALFKAVWIPQVWTEDYLNDHAHSLRSLAQMVEEGVKKQETVKALILPMVRGGRTDRKIPQRDSA